MKYLRGLLLLGIFGLLVYVTFMDYLERAQWQHTAKSVAREFKADKETCK